MFIQPISPDTDTLYKLAHVHVHVHTHTQTLTFTHSLSNMPAHKHTHSNRALCKQTIGLSVFVPGERERGEGEVNAYQCIIRAELKNQVCILVLNWKCSMQINSVQSQLPMLDSNLKTFKSILAPLPYQD